MASKAIIIKDLNKFKLSYQNELKIRKIKHLLKHPIVQIKKFNLNQLQKINARKSLSQVKYRCAITGRSQGIVRHFQLSRIQLKTLSSNGLIPGLRKSSW